MGTEYSKIYNKFSKNITDYKILQFDDEDVKFMLKEWLTAAVAKQKPFIHELEMDEDFDEFTEDLTTKEIEVLALAMVEEWLRPQINSSDFTSLFIAGKEEKFFSPSAQLEELVALKDNSRIERKRIVKDYGYRNNRYLGNVE